MRFTQTEMADWYQAQVLPQVAALQAAHAQLVAENETARDAMKAVLNDLQGLAFAEHGCIELAHDYSPNLHKLVSALNAQEKKTV